MEKLRSSLSALPPLTLSIATLLAILWLTLSPRPFGDQEFPLFEGADKVAHALIFGFFCIVMLIDWQRRHYWTPLRWQTISLAAIISFLLGVTIEYLQLSMAATLGGFNRGFDIYDIIADGIGVLLFANFWMIFQNSWARDRV